MLAPLSRDGVCQNHGRKDFRRILRDAAIFSSRSSSPICIALSLAVFIKARFWTSNNEVRPLNNGIQCSDRLAESSHLAPHHQPNGEATELTIQADCAEASGSDKGVARNIVELECAGKACRRTGFSTYEHGEDKR